MVVVMPPEGDGGVNNTHEYSSDKYNIVSEFLTNAKFILYYLIYRMRKPKRL
jgi:hypothetical protein